MSYNTEFQSLDEEVRELLLNYKHKKATTYEPCTLKNYKECLIGLGEEFGLFNINYVFNPHLDFDDKSLRLESLVKLINSIWTLLNYHKNVSAKSEELAERNHILEQNNKMLNGLVEKLKEKLNSEKNESKACVATAQKIADNSDVMLQKLTNAQIKITQLTKQKAACEKSLHNEITRLKLQNEKLLDRIRSKTTSSCTESCDMTVQQLKDKERRQRCVIAQLQKNNQDLLREVLDMKEELILGGLKHYKLEDKPKK